MRQLLASIFVLVSVSSNTMAFDSANDKHKKKSYVVIKQDIERRGISKYPGENQTRLTEHCTIKAHANMKNNRYLLPRGKKYKIMYTPGGTGNNFILKLRLRGFRNRVKIKCILKKLPCSISSSDKLRYFSKELEDYMSITVNGETQESLEAFDPYNVLTEKQEKCVISVNESQFSIARIMNNDPVTKFPVSPEYMEDHLKTKGYCVTPYYGPAMLLDIKRRGSGSEQDYEYSIRDLNTGKVFGKREEQGATVRTYRPGRRVNMNRVRRMSYDEDQEKREFLSSFMDNMKECPHR